MGDGVIGRDAVLADLNRPAYANAMVPEWLPQLPDVQARLADATRPARVGDFGCGAGWSTIELAKAYPHLRLDGYDSDEASIAAARRNAAEHGVADRVDFEVIDLSDPAADWSPRYDAVFLFECLHDLPRPVEALVHTRQSLNPQGTVIVMEERAASTSPHRGIRRSGSSRPAVRCGAFRRAWSGRTHVRSARSCVRTRCGPWPPRPASVMPP
jgi:trans-aconitate methyltransferase